MLPKKHSEKDQASCHCISYTSTRVHLLQRSHWEGLKTLLPQACKMLALRQDSLQPRGGSACLTQRRPRKATRILAGSFPIFSPSEGRDFPIPLSVTLLSASVLLTCNTDVTPPPFQKGLMGQPELELLCRVWARHAEAGHEFGYVIPELQTTPDSGCNLDAAQVEITLKFIFRISPVTDALMLFLREDAISVINFCYLTEHTR